MNIPKTDLSSKPRTIYGELFEPKPYNPDLIPATVWENLPIGCTKVDLQYDDDFATPILEVLRVNNIQLPVGYRPMDVRHTGKEFSGKAYIIVKRNDCSDELVAAVRALALGRGRSGGIREGRSFIRIASVYLAICALKKGYPLHIRRERSRYQRAERRVAINNKLYGSQEPLFQGE